jgi:DNA repair photolyase
MQSKEPLADLERNLERLSARGELRQTTVIFGVTTDPFHPFDEKFATSMRFLELFERYSPGKLIIQTRSPLVVIGLPVLKKVKNTTFVSIGIETPSDEVRQRYTPTLPSVSERWKTVRALKRFGLKVGIQVSPLLPYGDWREDASAFAEDLVAEADWVSVTSIAQGAGNARPSGVLARKLAAERQFFWLRADTHRPLSDALHRIAPEKMYHPAAIEVPNPQLQLFGA